MTAGCNSNHTREIDIDVSLMGYNAYAALTDSLRQNPDAEKYFRRGRLAFTTGTYQSAYNDYANAFKLKPCTEYAEAVVSSLYQLEKYDSVIRFTGAEKKYFYGSRLHEILSSTYEKSGDYKQALFHLEEQMKTDTLNKYLLFQKGILLEYLGDTAQAISYYEQTLQSLPAFADVKFALANLYAETGNRKTLALCNLMLKDTAGFHAEPYYLQGVYYSHSLQPGMAYDAFNKAIGKDWKYIAAYIDKGKVQFNKKDYTAALRTFEVALSVSNTDADIYYWIGRCKEALNLEEEAIDYYKKALGMDENDEEAREALKRLKVN
jgi:tetratricopeptide (TPR) repeat protein